MMVGYDDVSDLLISVHLQGICIVQSTISKLVKNLMEVDMTTISQDADIRIQLQMKINLLTYHQLALRIVHLRQPRKLLWTIILVNRWLFEH